MLVDGIDPYKSRAAAVARVGYVPQQPAIYRALSVGEHLDYAAHMRAGFDQVGARTYVDQFGVPLTSRPGSLSGGQQTQVTLALALGTRVDILLLDEPLASLDPLARSEFLHILRSAVVQRGATALLSSHVVTDMLESCDRLVVLGIGRVLFHDSLRSAVANHAVKPVDGPSIPGFSDIGTFQGPRGELQTLVRGSIDNGRSAMGGRMLRQATLDEIVKGYLIADRQPLSKTAH